MEHSISSGPWAVGNTVTVYAHVAITPISASAPPGRSAVDTAVVASNGSVTWDGLEAGTDYWAIGQDPGGTWRWVKFTSSDYEPVNVYLVEDGDEPARPVVGSLIVEKNGDMSLDLYEVT